jgi:hypothetical protein
MNQTQGTEYRVHKVQNRPYFALSPATMRVSTRYILSKVQNLRSLLQPLKNGQGTEYKIAPYGVSKLCTLQTHWAAKQAPSQPGHDQPLGKHL